MIIDKRNEFVASQALTATAVLTDSIDLSSDRDIGVGEDLYWVINQLTIADGVSTDETYVFTLQTDDNSGFSSPTTIATITIPRSSPAGTRWYVSLPNTNERYLRVNVTLGGTTPSVTVQSAIVSFAPQWAALPDAIN